MERVWLCGVSKRMGILVVKLKAIKYKEDSFCYLSSSRPWPSGCMPYDPVLPAVCLQNFHILGGTHLFTQAFSDPRSVLQSKPLFAEFLADPHKTNFSCSNWVDQTPGSHTHCVKQAVPPTTRMVVSKAASCWSRTLPRNYASYWLRLGLAIGWPSHWLANCKALRGDLDP